MNNDYNNYNNQQQPNQQQPYQQPNQQPNQQPYQQPYQQNYQQPYQQNYQQNYQQPYQQNYQQNYQQPYQQNYQQQYQNMESKASQALAFGIVGLFFFGIIFGILAITNASACKKAGYTNGKVTAGFVLGIIDVSLITLGNLIVFITTLAQL